MSKYAVFVLTIIFLALMLGCDSMSPTGPSPMVASSVQMPGPGLQQAGTVISNPIPSPEPTPMDPMVTEPEPAPSEPEPEPEPDPEPEPEPPKPEPTPEPTPACENSFSYQGCYNLSMPDSLFSLHSQASLTYQGDGEVGMFMMLDLGMGAYKTVAEGRLYGSCSEPRSMDMAWYTEDPIYQDAKLVVTLFLDGGEYHRFELGVCN